MTPDSASAPTSRVSNCGKAIRRLGCRTSADAHPHQVMEAFDMFLNGNFVALPAFQRKYGVYVPGSGYTIPTRWQSALFQSGQCGAFIGVFLAGPVTNRLGYRWTAILALIMMNATIFISFFVGSPAPLSSLPPNQTPLGRLSHRPGDRTSVRRCPLGVLHRELPGLRQRGRSSRSSRGLHVHSANELVDRSNHCRRRHLWLQ